MYVLQGLRWKRARERVLDLSLCQQRGKELWPQGPLGSVRWKEVLAKKAVCYLSPLFSVLPFCQGLGFPTLPHCESLSPPSLCLCGFPSLFLPSLAFCLPLGPSSPCCSLFLTFSSCLSPFLSLSCVCGGPTLFWCHFLVLFSVTSFGLCSVTSFSLATTPFPGFS